MQRTIQQYLDNEWLSLITKPEGFMETEAGYSYVHMFNQNLHSALTKINDTHIFDSQLQQKERLLDFGFEFIAGDFHYNIYYKTGRLITQVNNNFAMSYQYKGKLPIIFQNSPTITLTPDGIYSDNVNNTTACITINQYMEDNGEFIEPWLLDRFDTIGSPLINEVLRYLPQEYTERLLDI